MTNPSAGAVNLPARIVKNMAIEPTSCSERDSTAKVREASGDHV